MHEETSEERSEEDPLTVTVRVRLASSVEIRHGRG